MELQTTPMESRLQKRKKGFTLTEIAIVLGIIGLILGAIWVAAASVYQNQRVNQAQTGILQLLQGVRTLYSQQATMGAGDQSLPLVNAGVVPTNLIKTGAAAFPYIISPWGGNMFVGGTTDGLGIEIGLDKMSAAICVALTAAIYGASHDRTLENSGTSGNATFGGFTAIAAVGTPVSSTAPPVVGGSPVAAPATGTGCTAGSNLNNQIFVFGVQG